jgi:uncharacterized protein
MSHPSWQNSIAVIVGASTGFGAQLAEVLASRQTTLFLIARNATALQAFADELRRRHPQAKIEAIAADAQELASLQQAADAVQQRVPKIDLLINAVGKSDRGRLLELNDSDLQNLFAINVLTAIHGTRAFHSLLKNARGTIINIGSLSSKFAPRFLGGYSITKFGLAAASQQLRLELAEDDIHVMLACPGPIARADGHSRYADLASERNLPSEAQGPGGGAKLKGLDPLRLAIKILDGAASRYPELMFPAKSRLLLLVQAISPAWGDWLLRKKTS